MALANTRQWLADTCKLPDNFKMVLITHLQPSLICTEQPTEQCKEGNPRPILHARHTCWKIEDQALVSSLLACVASLKLTGLPYGFNSLCQTPSAPSKEQTVAGLYLH